MLMGDDPAVKVPKVPGRRRHRLTIGGLMAAVLVIAVGLGWVTHRDRSRRRAEALLDRLRDFFYQLEVSNPKEFQSESLTGIDEWLGSGFRFQGEHRTPTRRPIVVEADVHVRPFDDLGHVVISSGGRSVTWPIEDIERGREIDLRAEFPEAFR